MVFVTDQAVKESILNQLTNASQMVKLEKDPHAAFALIIDGKTLAYILEDDMKHQFLGLAVDCASVICCRVSPRQKAMVGSSFLLSISNCPQISYILLFNNQIIDILMNMIFYMCSFVGLFFICSILTPGNKVSKRRNWENHLSDR